MAAPILSKFQQQNATLKGQAQTKQNVKNVLVSPYTFTWPALKESTHEEIIKKLLLTFTSLNLARLKRSWIRGKAGKKRKKEKQESEKRILENPKTKNIREQLVVGLNSTTRCLERSCLRVVLVDQSTRPTILTRHLVTSAAVRDCPILFINKLARTLAPQLGVSSLCALGFRKLSEGDEPDLNDVIEFLVERAVPVNIPWLKCGQSTEHDEKTLQDMNTEGDGNTPVEITTDTACPTDCLMGSDHVEDSFQTTQHDCDMDPSPNVTNDQPAIGEPHTGLLENKVELPPINFDAIYVQQSESFLMDGKIQVFGFGKIGFVGFDDSSDEFIPSRENDVKKVRATKGSSKWKIPRRGLKRKVSCNEANYVTARIGKVKSNQDRQSAKIKKKKKAN